MIAHRLFSGPIHLIALKLAARLSSLASIGLLLAFIFGEFGSPTPAEMALLAFFPFGVMIGMVIGWWKDLIGGAVTVSALAAFYLLFTIQSSHIPPGPYFALFALPGGLFLVAGLLERRTR